MIFNSMSQVVWNINFNKFKEYSYEKECKEINFFLEGMRNVYWDESPIAVGCEVSIPFKFDGNQPLCIISHGSGGLGNDTEHFVNILNDLGVATLCIDSFHVET